MNVLDLFSGIGGFSLGLERAGFRTAAFCEIDLYCRRVLAKHWPDVPIHEDITELDGGEYRGTVDLVCGGFPCQPFSQAGKRRGKDDDRALWPEMFRVIREVQPAWVIGENVIGLESLALSDCISDLESIGYAVQVFDIPACGVGADHRRHRLWILAHANGSGLRQEQGREQSGRTGAAKPFDYGSPQSDPDADYWRQQGEWLTEHEAAQCSVGPTKPAIRRGHDGVSHQLDGGGLDAEFSRVWEINPMTAEGIPDRVARLRALGNAVVPQIPEIIGRAILKEENRNE